MSEITTIGLDLAKHVFQVHAVDREGRVMVRRALRRGQVIKYFAELGPCLVGIEACATAHYWAREIARLGHQVRLIAPADAKAYVRRNKNDAADAAAICEAVSRPQMRFVPVKSAAQQAACGGHRVRALLVKQRTMLINALRGLMAEYGVIAGRGPQHVAALAAVLNDPTDDRIAAPLRAALKQIVGSLERLQVEIECLEREIVHQARANPICRRLATIPGYGPIVASAMVAAVIDPGGFASARHFAAAVGLTPRHSGTGGRQRLGPISKRGNGYLRRLLVNGAMAALRSNWGKADPWLQRLAAEKKRLVVACALANKMARIGWAVMVQQENFRATAAA
jgi:transposase